MTSVEPSQTPLKSPHAWFITFVLGSLTWASLKMSPDRFLARSACGGANSCPKVVRVGHGVFILGVVHVFASLPEVIKGIERWLSYVEGREDSRPSRDGPDGGSKEGARDLQRRHTPDGPTR
jgi:hypothetical protein